MPIASLLRPFITHQNHSPFPSFTCLHSRFTRHRAICNYLRQRCGIISYRKNYFLERGKEIISSTSFSRFFFLLFRILAFAKKKKKREGRRRKESNKRSTRRRLRTRVADVDSSTSIFRFIARLITANFGDLDRGYIYVYIKLWPHGISRNTVDKSS